MACVHYSKDVSFSHSMESHIRELDRQYLPLSLYLLDIEIEYVRRKLRIRNVNAFELVHVSRNYDYSKNVVVYFRDIEKYRVVRVPRLEPHYYKKPVYKIRYCINWLKPDKTVITKYYDTYEVYSRLKIGSRNKYGWKVIKKYQDSCVSHYYDSLDTYSLTF